MAMYYESNLHYLLQAQFDASELITQREMVSQKVSEELTDRALQFGLVLDDISLVSVCLSCSLTKKFHN